MTHDVNTLISITDISREPKHGMNDQLIWQLFGTSLSSNIKPVMLVSKWHFNFIMATVPWRPSQNKPHPSCYWTEIILNRPEVALEPRSGSSSGKQEKPWYISWQSCNCWSIFLCNKCLTDGEANYTLSCVNLIAATSHNLLFFPAFCTVSWNKLVTMVTSGMIRIVRSLDVTGHVPHGGLQGEDRIVTSWNSHKSAHRLGPTLNHFLLLFVVSPFLFSSSDSSSVLFGETLQCFNIVLTYSKWIYTNRYLYGNVSDVPMA